MFVEELCVGVRIDKREVNRMKYIKMVLIVILFFVLFGCAPKIPNTEKGKELLPAIDKSFSLYIVDKPKNIPKLEELRQIGISNVTKINTSYALEYAKREYPFLKLEKEPTYIVFNHEKIIYQTDERDKMIEFLQKRMK